MPSGGSKDFEKILRKRRQVSDENFREITQIALVYLRTPLTGIVGYLTMIHDGDFGKLASDQKKVIGDLLKEGQRLIRIVNGLSKLGRLPKDVGKPPHQNESEEKPKILLFEDEKMIADMYATKFRQANFAVRTYYVPPKNLEQEVTRGKPDLIITGIIMPKIDGFRVLERIKADRRTRGIPVVILSNLGQKEEIEQGIRLGAAAAYLVKARYTPSEVVAKVCELLGLPTPVEERTPGRS